MQPGQDAIGLLGHLGTLLAHIQLIVDQHLQILFGQAAFQTLCPQPVALQGVVVTQVQDLAFCLIEPYVISFSTSIQPVQIPLQSLPRVQQINTPTQLGVVCKLTEDPLDCLVQVCQAEPAFHKPMLTGPDPLTVLYVPHGGTQDGLFHDLPQH
ncbi:integral membrane protein dgcr2 idd [Pitangus sulphuratus]|nr:integral membrane protein dgcr2 idd [Pitangus sulphuratus]